MKNQKLPADLGYLSLIYFSTRLLVEKNKHKPTLFSGQTKSSQTQCGFDFTVDLKHHESWLIVSKHSTQPHLHTRAVRSRRALLSSSRWTYGEVAYSVSTGRRFWVKNGGTIPDSQKKGPHFARKNDVLKPVAVLVWKVLARSQPAFGRVELDCVEMFREMKQRKHEHVVLFNTCIRGTSRLKAFWRCSST